MIVVRFLLEGMHSLEVLETVAKAEALVESWSVARTECIKGRDQNGRVYCVDPRRVQAALTFTLQEIMANRGQQGQAVPQATPGSGFQSGMKLDMGGRWTA